MERARARWTALVNGEYVIGPAVVAALTVGVASHLVGPTRGDVRVDVALASMGAFLFGLLLAFTIVRTRERLALVQDLVAKGDAALFSIHQMVVVYPEADRRRIRDLIDHHLTDQIDYRLVDYHRATPSYLALTGAVMGLGPRTAQEEAVYKELVGLCIGMGEYRALIEAAAGQMLSPIEWSGLLLLLAVLLSLIAVLPGGTVLGALVVATLAGALATLVVLVRKLDLLRWHERVTIWEPTTRLFRSMGRDPYVPRLAITSGRYRPTGRVRVVDYPDQYPERATKVVTVEYLGEGGGGPLRSVPSVAPEQVVVPERRGATPLWVAGEAGDH
ncbi:MAG TPA: hypothetical protein VMU09_05460 [Acidimicrobiales bacterium]|nr:hypothetical protein [Acidimicrobiales bacterium]